MAANFCSQLSGKSITLWMLCLAAALAFAAPVSVAQTFTSGSDGSDGAYDLTGTAPDTIVKFDPSQFHGSGVANNVFNFTTITIPSGVTVKLAGDRINGPVYWLASGTVDMEGTVDLSGQDGAPVTPILANRTRAIPGAGGFAGGVGGKANADPIPVVDPVAQPGDGPGGGAVKGTGISGCLFCAGLGGQNTANAFLVPLVGGSGGGGQTYCFIQNPPPLSNLPYGAGGGAGGGAILVASSTTITVNGTISTKGGGSGRALMRGQRGRCRRLDPAGSADDQRQWTFDS